MEEGKVVEQDYFERAKDLLPAWFIERMMTDEWTYGLMTPSGKVIVISTIKKVHQAKDGSIWIDVKLSRNPGFVDTSGASGFKGSDFVFCPTSREEASINTSHIICAFELADA
jgi:hypothetical protein